MGMTDLLPCPFCGMSLDLESRGEKFAMHQWSKDGCPLSSVNVYLPHWNRRAHLATETVAIQKVRDWLKGTADGRHNLNLAPCDCVRCQHAAALDEFLEGRK